MPNYLDFLVALDEHIRAGNLGYVMQGSDMFAISVAAGLTGPGDETPAHWVGQLARDHYVAHSDVGFGDHAPIPNGAYTSADLQRFRDYRVTAVGHETADRLRRQRREALTDAAFAGASIDLLRVVPDERHRAAIAHSMQALRFGLDAARHSEAIGSAKDLVEAACKVILEQAGQQSSQGAKLHSLYRQALEATGRTDPSSELGRSLITVVHRLAELRNASGAGHGQASPPQVSGADARLAASAACGLALHLLRPADDPRS